MGSPSSSGSDGESLSGRSGGTRRRRHDSESDGSSSESDSRSGGRGGGDRERRKREKKERKAAKKAAKKARKRERKEEKRARKRAKREARADERRSPTPPPPRAGGLEMRSREIAEAERAAREEDAKRDAEAAKAAAERASRAAEAAAAADAAAADAAAADAAAAVADAAPPVPGFGAAMTLEQYRAMAAAKPHLKGTVHATPKAEKDAAEDKAKKGWWPCQSYRCTRGSGANVMNPKYAEKCQRCGAMKPLGAGSDVFHNHMSDDQYLKNQSRRVGK